MGIVQTIAGLFKRNAPAVATTAQTAPGAVSVSGSDIYEKMKADRDRAAVVNTCIKMYKTDPRVKKAHRFYARDIVRAGYYVKTEDKQAKAIADALQTRLNLNQKLEDAVRETSRDGDSMYEVVVDENMDIVELSRKPTLQMHRNSNSRDTFDNPLKAFWQHPDSFHSLPPEDAVWYAQWQIIHARWDHEQNERYGTPMFASATGAFKKVEDGEINVAVRRKVGGSITRLHSIDGGSADVQKYKEDNAAVLGKVSAVIDLFTNKAASIDIKQGDGNLDKIGDVNHHVATMMAASDVPMELIVYGDGLNRDILGEKKEEYAETLVQGREWVTDQIIQPLIHLQWLLKGILPANVNYKINWRTGKTLTPADLRDLGDAMAKWKLLGADDTVLKQMAALYLRDVDMEILSGDGFSVEQFANNIKGISI